LTGQIPAQVHRQKGEETKGWRERGVSLRSVAPIKARGVPWCWSSFSFPILSFFWPQDPRPTYFSLLSQTAPCISWLVHSFHLSPSCRKPELPSTLFPTSHRDGLLKEGSGRMQAKTVRGAWEETILFCPSVSQVLLEHLS